MFVHFQRVSSRPIIMCVLANVTKTQNKRNKTVTSGTSKEQVSNRPVTSGTSKERIEQSVELARVDGMVHDL